MPMPEPVATAWPLPRQLVLVLGCARSGVSFAASQLAQHPDALLLDGPNGLAEAWLHNQLEGPAPESPGSPTPLGGATLWESAQRALALIHGAPPAAASPSRLILPLPQLLSTGGQAMALLHQAAELEPRPQLLEMVRDRLDVVSSLARFPHLAPDLPDPWAEPEAFHAAAELQWHRCGQSAQLLRQSGWTLPRVPYEQLVQRGPALLWQVLDWPPPAAGSERQPQGISPSLCFRERRRDPAGLGRWSRHQAAAGPPAPAPAPASPPPPLIATGRGGSGTRLLTLLLQGLGVHLGDSLNPSGDSVEWADLIYELSLATLVGHGSPWRGDWASELRHRARCVAPAGRPRPWGWKLPEAMLVLPHLTSTWPDTPIIHLVRHPVDACLRRTHMTSRVNNPIGRSTLGAAFAALGLDGDPANARAYWCNAVSWWYQLEQLQRCKAASSARGQRWIELRYEDICANPQREADRLADQLGLPRAPVAVPVDPRPSHDRESQDPRAAHVWELCGPIAERYGYALHTQGISGAQSGGCPSATQR